MTVGTYAPSDQKYSQYKNDLTPWLKDCPSQILRNSVTNWKDTYTKFLKGECGKPTRKIKSSGGSVHLTKFVRDGDGTTRLFIGSKRKPSTEAMALSFFITILAIPIAGLCGRIFVVNY